MKFNFIHKVAAVVMTVCALAVSSCGDIKDDIETPFSVSAKKSTVESQAGSMFVSVKCGGDWTLSVEYAGEEQPWATVNPEEGSGDRNSVKLAYEANTSGRKRTLNLVLVRKNDSKTSGYSVTQLAEGEKEETPPEEEKPVTDVLKAKWLELPAMTQNSGLEYYAHSFEMDGNTYRNYSFGWSQKDLVAIWVAYPLNKFYTSGNAGRTDAWAYDPVLGPKYSPAPFAGYAEELARGHQLPSADRQCSKEANYQTFYGTNMTPQLNEHNEGIWSTLEGSVRKWANTSDTTYVVTGCTVEGAKRITKDSDGKNITVPVAYWKALLRYSTSSTISTWACAAFYTEHKNYNGNNDLKAVSMSIDELEEITGLDFFPNLEERLGKEKAAALEAQDPETSNIWWK